MKLTSFNVAVIEGDTHLSKWIEDAKTIEIAKDWPIGLYKHLIPQGGTVIDVGACLGDHTVTYAKLVGPSGYVIGVEINPVAFECLQHNTAAFPWVSVEPCGFGDKPGTVGFTRNPNEGASAIDPNGEIKVPVIRMDDALSDLLRVDFIKIDAEGYEPFILEGGREIIQRFRPTMFIEVNKGALARYGKTEDDIFNFLGAIGYSYRITPSTAKKGDPQYDILCRP